MSYKSAVATRIHPLYRRGIAHFRRSRFLARHLFGVKRFPSTPLLYWDWVTLCLRKAMINLDLEGKRFLDMGCGFAAILSILAHTRGCSSITAVDIVPEIVDSARAFLSLNNVKSEVIQSDFGERLPGEKYDIIAFNSAYIPEAWGKSQKLNQEIPVSLDTPSVTWSGGRDGTEGLERFLDSMHPFLKPGGHILLGFNRFYVKPERVREIVRRKNLIWEGAACLPLVPPVVFSLGLSSS